MGESGNIRFVAITNPKKERKLKNSYQSRPYSFFKIFTAETYRIKSTEKDSNLIVQDLGGEIMLSALLLSWGN